MNPGQVPSSPQPQNGESYFIPVPPRVAMAMQFLGFGENLRRGPMPGMLFGQPDPAPTGRSLSQVEQEVYDSALKVLYIYFEGQELPSAEEFIQQSNSPGQDDDGANPVPYQNPS